MILISNVKVGLNHVLLAKNLIADSAHQFTLLEVLMLLYFHMSEQLK